MFDPGRETRETIKGKVWTFSRMTPAVIFGFRDWIKQKIGDPFAVAERFAEKLPPAETIALIKEAQSVKEQLDCFSLNTPLAQRYVETEEGATELFRLLLVEHHPDITSELAFDLMVEVGAKKVVQIAETAQGQLQPEKNS